MDNTKFVEKDFTLEEVKLAYMVFLNMSMNKMPLKTIFAIKKILLCMESYVNKANETGEELKRKYAVEIEKANEAGDAAVKEIENKINTEYLEWLRTEVITLSFETLPASAIENVELSLGSANCIEKFLNLEA